MNLAENLKKIRKEHNLSQEQLAEQLGVSRQAVSKWESNQAYPEMDKVIQLSKMFNLNIDDLLNQDIKEVNIEKQSKTMVNKYIDDFLNFITKTIDMFSSMKFKDKCKCITEQIIIGCLLALIFLIIGGILGNIISGLFTLLPDKVFYIITSILESIYLIFSLVFGLILLIHIFKVRYLDYYVIIKENDNTIDNENNKAEEVEEPKEISKEDNKENKKIYLEKKKEKVIIRDPKHSEYRFISGILKVLLIFIKSIALMIALVFSISLICLVLSLVISFLIIKTGLLFFGIILTILSLILLNIYIIIILYNFVFNRKTNKKRLLITIIISLLLCGSGIGLGTIGFTEFNYYDDINSDDYQTDEITIQKKENLVIQEFIYYGDNIKYIEEDRNDIKIVYRHSKYYDLSYNEEYDSFLHLYLINEDSNSFDFARQVIKDINNKKVVNYSKFEATIYTSKENIEKLQNNKKNYYKIIEERNNYYNELEEKNNNYLDRIYELEEKLNEKNNELEDKKTELSSLQKELNQCSDYQ